MKVLLAEPFFAGSHRQWAERIQRFSRHDWYFLTLEGKFWKWRIRGGGMILGQRYNELEVTPDLLVASSMLDLSSMIATISKEGGAIPPIVLYAHENQFLYPIPEDRPAYREQRDHFGAVNWRSALLADHVIYNSEFHREAAIEAYEDFIQRAPDHRDPSLLEGLSCASSVFPPAPDLASFDDKDHDAGNSGENARILLWNHRWEGEKGPRAFAELVDKAIAEGYDLRLALAGPSGREEGVRKGLAYRYPERTLLAEEIGDRESYKEWLLAADFIFSSSQQDFFGISVVEAMYCGTVPILPDRLAYPEHLTSSLKNLLYKDLDQALRILGDLMEEENLEARKQEARKAVLPYDVRNWIEDFDRLLEEVKEGRLA